MAGGDAARRILRRQRLKEARAWLDEDPARARIVEDILAGRAQLQQLPVGGRAPALVSDLVRQDHGLALAELRALFSCAPTSSAYRDIHKAELFFRAIPVAPGFWRSCQPRHEHLCELREACGLRAVVNLRAESHQSRRLCRELELSYHPIPVVDASPPDRDQVRRFLELVAAHQGLLVHCHAGKGRTGTFVACYRVSGGIPPLEALRLTEHEVGELHPVQRAWVMEYGREGFPV